MIEVLSQYQGGMIDYNRVALIQERLVERQQTLAEAQAEIAQGLVQTYRALGGGWQIHCAPAWWFPLKRPRFHPRRPCRPNASQRRRRRREEGLGAGD